MKQKRHHQGPPLIVGILFAVILALGVMTVNALGAEKIDSIAKTVAKAEHGMTMWQTLAAGGWVMIVLGILSLVLVALVVYMFLKFRPSKLVPADFFLEVYPHLKQKKMGVVRQMCEENKGNLIATVILAGLDKFDAGPAAAREGVELSARRETGASWQSLSYLADISSMAPMIGLLGTVLGMIEAFNAIAFNTGVAKPMMLAGGVSKSMVTTAGGLIVAITAVICYALLKPKVQRITHDLEMYSNDIANAFSGAEKGTKASS